MSRWRASSPISGAAYPMARSRREYSWARFRLRPGYSMRRALPISMWSLVTEKPEITALARELLAAWDQGRTIPSIAARQPGFGWGEAYRVLAEILRLRRA